MPQNTRAESYKSTSCAPPFGKADQVRSKLNDHSERDQDARKIGRQPTWIMDDLQDSDLAFAFVVVLVEPRLIKGFAVVTQRLVHRDFHLPIFAGAGAPNLHAAGEV